MYSNNSSSVRDALCFFMDEEKGNEIAFVQFPQMFDNITKNDIYGSTLRVISEVGIIIVFMFKWEVSNVVNHSFLFVCLELLLAGGIPRLGWLWRSIICWNWLFSQERYLMWEKVHHGK